MQLRSRECSLRLPSVSQFGVQSVVLHLRFAVIVRGCSFVFRVNFCCDNKCRFVFRLYFCSWKSCFAKHFYEVIVLWLVLEMSSLGLFVIVHGFVRLFTWAGKTIIFHTFIQAGSNASAVTPKHKRWQHTGVDLETLFCLQTASTVAQKHVSFTWWKKTD